MARLNGMRLVLPAAGSPRRREFEQIFMTYGVRPIPAVESDERGGWLRSVRAEGASLLWYRAMAEQAVRAGLAVRSLDPALKKVIAVVHARRRLPSVAQDFLSIAEGRTAA
jgi:hypothetical protein